MTMSMTQSVFRVRCIKILSVTSLKDVLKGTMRQYWLTDKQAVVKPTPWAQVLRWPPAPKKPLVLSPGPSNNSLKASTNAKMRPGSQEFHPPNLKCRPNFSSFTMKTFWTCLIMPLVVSINQAMGPLAASENDLLQRHQVNQGSEFTKMLTAIF